MWISLFRLQTKKLSRDKPAETIMLFNSIEFVTLFAVTGILYYFPGLKRYQVFTLIVSSFVFYAHHNPALSFLLLFSILSNAASSFAIITNSLSKGKWVAAFAVTVNLFVLCWFKYAGLITLTILGKGLEDNSVGAFLLSIPLPLGISFFTFQGISLVMDCFRTQTKKDTNESANTIHKTAELGFLKYTIDTALYISFFPQLVAGPIVKARDFFHQITHKSLENIQWEKVFRFLVIGYFLKMVVADNLKDLTYYLNYPLFINIDCLTLLTLLFGYSVQIFADFAGYSSIAIGLSAFFGYNIPVNFNRPYKAQSFANFWSRWHISLSTWLRQYLYFPLGGNKKGSFRTFINLFIVMFLGGLWHGAGWNYAFWGILHGLALAVERLTFGAKPPDSKSTLIAIMRVMMIFIFVTHAWLLFILENFDQYIAFWGAILQNRGIPNLVWMTFVGLYSIPVILYHLKDKIAQAGKNHFTNWMEPLAFAIMLWLIIFNSGSAGEFIYFQF